MKLTEEKPYKRSGLFIWPLTNPNHFSSNLGRKSISPYNQALHLMEKLAPMIATIGLMMELMFLAVGEESISNHGALLKALRWPHIFGSTISSHGRQCHSKDLSCRILTQWESNVAITGHRLFKKEILPLLGVGCVCASAHTHLQELQQGVLCHEKFHVFPKFKTLSAEIKPGWWYL